MINTHVFFSTRAGAVSSACLALLLTACGAEDPNPQSGTGGTGGSGAGPTTASTGGSGTGTGIPTKEWQVGFLPETEPGSGPAALSFANESTGIMSGVIQETTFWQVAPGTSEPWLVARSADVQADATIGFHEDFSPETPCSFLPVIVSGVPELVPGQAYLFRIVDEGNSYTGEIVDDTPVDFVGLRAYLADPLPPSSTSTITIDGQSEPIELALLQSDSSLYQSVAEASVTVSAVTLTSSAGEEWRADMSTTLGAAPGYTLYLGTSPPPDAENVTVLEPVR